MALNLWLLNFPHSAYLVTKSPKELYDGLSAATLVLTGTAPSVNFRCGVTLSPVSGHADCAGTVTVGSEVLTFTGANRQTTTTLLTAIPTITTSNIDCQILVECIDSQGSIIPTETLTPIKIRYEPTTRAYMGAGGEWTMSQSFAMVVNESIKIADIIRYNSVDYYVKQIEAYPWLDGQEVYRILYF